MNRGLRIRSANEGRVRIKSALRSTVVGSNYPAVNGRSQPHHDEIMGRTSKNQGFQDKPKRPQRRAYPWSNKGGNNF